MKVNDVTGIKIYGTCYSTYPCQHKCCLSFGSKHKTTTISAKKIIKVLHFLKWPVPDHFKEYQEASWTIANDAPKPEHFTFDL